MIPLAFASTFVVEGGVSASGHLSPGAEQVVYDNTTKFLHTEMPLLPEWRNDSAEMGDEIHLAGTEREIIELRVRFWYRGTVPGTLDARVRFRPIADKAEEPGPPFYEGPLIVGLRTEPGMSEYKFKIPNVKVPDRFVWTIQVYNRKGSVGELGPAYYNPPSIGSSDDFFWQSDMGSKWIRYSWGGQPIANFGAIVIASSNR